VYPLHFGGRWLSDLRWRADHRAHAPTWIATVERDGQGGCLDDRLDADPVAAVVLEAEILGRVARDVGVQAGLGGGSRAVAREPHRMLVPLDDLQARPEDCLNQRRGDLGDSAIHGWHGRLAVGAGLIAVPDVVG